ncbi:calcium-binding protein [Sulfitobacter sp.]|uniref:calcium-binding protein n=1 Tax=Sulfitobacter sp. TaxID=1903071 RepID=UPI003001099B
MPVLRHVGTWFSGSFDAASSAISIRQIQTPSGGFFEIDDFVHLSTQRMAVQGDAAPATVSTVQDVPSARLHLAVEGRAGSLPANALTNAVATRDAGDTSGHLSSMGLGGFVGRAVNVLAAEVGGQDILYVARPDGVGVTRLRVDDGQLFGDRTFGTQDSLYTSGISDMALVETASASFLFLGSALDCGITQFEIGAHGGLDDARVLGREQSLPVQTVTALEAVEIAGQDYLIVAASGSSSLSVLSVSSGVVLGVADHLIDGRETRFQGVSQLEKVTVAGHVFVLASGMDNGISLFRLTAEGHLVHQGSFADTMAAGLQGVSAIGAMAGQGGIDVLVTSANEAGLTRMHIAFAEPGIVAARETGSVSGSTGDDVLSLRDGNGDLSAGDGDDIISDGAGRNRMYGGAGADVFVLMADGQRDVIEDLEIGQDTIDLSAWGMLYNLNQIDIQSTSRGAVLRYGAEELELVNQAGTSLGAADLAGVLLEFLSHMSVTLGPLRVTEVQPVDPSTPLQFNIQSVKSNVHTGKDLPPPLSDPTPSPDPVPTPAPTPAPRLAPAPALHGVKLQGRAGDDLLEGGAWDDEIQGYGGDDTLFGGGGDDNLKGQDGHDWLWGGAGNDKLPGESGNDRIFGEDGNDRLGGGYGNDRLEGGNGKDRGGGGPGNDTILGGDGDDVFSGGPGDDYLDGGAGNDMLAGSYTHDTVIGGTGNDTMGGGEGNDWMDAGSGDDVIGAGNHNDTVRGGAGNDFLGGGDGNDLIYGDAGQDTINPGYGSDTLYGGGGRDTFVFNTLSAGGTAVIQDFEDGVDRLRVIGMGRGSDPMSLLDISTGSLDGKRGAIVEYGAHTILLVDIDPDDLSSSDFLFV